MAITTKYWVAPSGAPFDTTANWSLSSGGSGGEPVPGPSDAVVFDGSGQGSCIFENTVDVLSMQVTSDYFGVLLQQTDPVTIRSDASFNGGTFSGSDASINIYGNLFIGSSNFISTSGVMTLWGEMIFQPTATSLTVEDFLIEEYELNSLNVSSKSITLNKFPSEGELMAVNVIEGVPQYEDEDYYVYGLDVRWDGHNLDGHLSIGDVLRVKYSPDDSPGRFFHNFGVFRVMSTGANFYPNGAEFYDFLVDDDGTTTGYRWFDTTCYVNNRLLLNEGYMRHGSDGTVHARGDVYALPNFGMWSGDHNVTLMMDASASQNVFTTGGVLPTLWVDKTTTSQVRLFGQSPMYVNGDFLISDGTFNTNGLNVKVGVQ